MRVNMASIIEKIRWLGHSSFVYSGSLVVYFDPFGIPGGTPADIILVSHTHRDHFSPDDVKKIAKQDTTLVISADGPADFVLNTVRMRPGDTKEVKGATIEAVPAYNTSTSFHPKGNNWLGYIVTIDGARIYHAGDTDFIPEMEGLSADVGLIPVGGTFTMAAEEASRAVRAMRLKQAVPMHWGEIVGTKKDAQEFARLVGDACEVVIMEKDA
jgi:L-ascorbate metabolism protein UlaG (beta-lactamase superfamily)